MLGVAEMGELVCHFWALARKKIKNFFSLKISVLAKPVSGFLLLVCHFFGFGVHKYIEGGVF